MMDYISKSSLVLLISVIVCDVYSATCTVKDLFGNTIVEKNLRLNDSVELISKETGTKKNDYEKMSYKCSYTADSDFGLFKCSFVLTQYLKYDTGLKAHTLSEAESVVSLIMNGEEHFGSKLTCLN